MSTTAPKPRVIDPAIAALRQKHAADVANLRFVRKSAETVNRIIEKELDKLTDSDKSILMKTLHAATQP